MATRDETIKLSLIDGVTKNLTAIQKGVSGVGAELAKLNQVAELAGKGFEILAGAVEGVSGAVVAVGDLESALARVADITSATADEQVALQEAVDNAVSAVGVSAESAAGALLLMAEDGFTAAEAVSQLNTVLSYAKANAQDAATATQALGGVLDTFGEKPAIIGELADQLTAASRAAGVGSITLQNGLAAIGVQAEQAGLGVSEATAALAALASRGIEGTQAAKQLGTVLTELNNPASKAGKALDEAGLSGKSFAEIVDVLSKDATKAAPVLEALGNRPRAALKVLLADGGGALREFTGIVNDAGGASAAAAAKIDETFNGALARLQATIDNLRNKFLAPILQPLADEFAAVSVQINALADSPQFARIREQFAAFATAAIKSLGDLVANVDLQELAGSIADFGARAKTAFESLVVVVETTASAIRGIAAAIEYVRAHAEDFAEWAGIAAGGATRLNIAAQEAGKGLGHLGGQLDKNKKSTREFATGADDASKSARQLGDEVTKTGAAAAKAADEVAVISSPSEEAKAALVSLAGGAEQAAIGLERMRLATLASAIATLADEGMAASDTYRALTAEFAKTEQNIATMQAAIDKAAASQQNLGEKTDGTTQSLRNFSGAARDAGSAAESTAGAGSQVSESFGNIGKTAAAAKADMGNMSAALLALAIEMQSTARSGKEIIKIWEGVTNQYNESNKRIEEAIALEERRNAQFDKEAKIRRQLEAQYGTDSTLLEKLIQLRLRANDETERTISLAERETQAIEQKNRAQAGALNFGTPEASATPASTGARGGEPSAAAGVRGPAPSITVNVQGLPDGREGWRTVVSEVIVPELERLGRLSR